MRHLSEMITTEAKEFISSMLQKNERLQAKDLERNDTESSEKPNDSE